MDPKKRPLKTLERVLSKAGVGSRVDARSWIHAGRVKVNGRLTRNPDQWVDMKRDRVLFDGVGGDLHELELVRTVATPRVTHLKFARR